MEGSAVLTVACIDEDHRQSGLQAFIQCSGQLLDVLLLLDCVLRLGQHQHIEIRKGGGVLHCQAEVVQMLCHDLRQGLVIIVAGGPILCTAEILHIDLCAVPANLAEIQLGHGLESQIIYTGKDDIACPQTSLQIGDLIFLDAVLGGGIVNANEHMEPVAADPADGFQQFSAEGQLVDPVLRVAEGGIVHRAVLKAQQIVAVGVRIVGGANIFQRQFVPSEGFPGCRADGPHGVVVFQRAAGVAHGGGQPHNAVQQPDLVVGVLRQSGQQAFQQICQRPRLTVTLCGGFRQTGGHQSTIEQLVHGKKVAVTA